LKISETIQVVPEILSLAATFHEEPLELSLQDSIVHHLDNHNASPKCFLNRNSRDFNKPNIHATTHISTKKL
jgi:hypothetical protein